MRIFKPLRITDEKSLPSTAYPAPPQDTKRLDKAFGLGKSANRLPIATEATVNKEMWSLLWSHKRGFLLVALLQLLTTSAALIPPRAFGNLLDTLKRNPDAVDINRTGWRHHVFSPHGWNNLLTVFPNSYRDRC